MACLVPIDSFVGALDQLRASLGQDLDRDVVGNRVLVDDLANELEVGVGRRREPDLDLREAHLDERLEHLPLALGVHGLDERLVAVAKIDRTPQWCLGDRVRGQVRSGRSIGANGRYFSTGIADEVWAERLLMSGFSYSTLLRLRQVPQNSSRVSWPGR